MDELGSELPTHKLHIVTLADVDQKIHQSVHLPLTIICTECFNSKQEYNKSIITL